MIKTEDIVQVCKNTSQALMNLSNVNNKLERNSHYKSRLLFPQYEGKSQKGKTRISEQEARILFCYELEKLQNEIFYSIETPTKNKYKFGKSTKDIIYNKGRSAILDLSLYKKKQNVFKQKFNIEFKAHNVKEHKIAKDLLKLISEPYCGLFFHTIESTDNGTLTTNGKQRGVLIKYSEAIRGIRTQIKDLYLKDEGQFILFCICSLSPKFILTKRVFKFNILKSFSSIGFRYEIKGNNIKILVKDGWELHKP